MTPVNIHATKTHLFRLLELAATGEEIMIAMAGTPLAKLAPLSPPGASKRRLDFWPVASRCQRISTLRCHPTSWRLLKADNALAARYPRAALGARQPFGRKTFRASVVSRPRSPPDRILGIF